MAAPLSIEVTAFTHRGRVRRENEDSITVGGWVSDVAMSDLRRSRHALDAPFLCAVADGLGGHSAGDVASRYAVKRLAAQSYAGADASVEAVLAAINAELYQAMATDRVLLGMGTTIVGLLLSATGVAWFNVGDSRLYRHRGGAVQQVSVDDVPPGERTGMLTQSLGGSFVFVPVEPHIGIEELTIPSRWLLCSDGLTDMLGDEEVARCLDAPDMEAAQSLFETAMRAGGHDNISAIIVSVGPSGR
jgi:serine/threonine protein phosphatase PrpC